MLFQVIARARRRLLWNALALQFAVAVVVALGVLVTLLLLGTDIVGWFWLIILPSVSLAAGVFMAWRRLPGACPTAQLLDKRLELADSLSTAVFFAASQQAGRCTAAFRQAQNEQAARIAGALDLRGAIPVRMPRAVYLSAVLTIAATGLFFVRYRTAARLDLRAPMAGIVQQILDNARAEIAKLVDEFARPKTADREESKEASNRPNAADGESAQGKPSGTGESNPAGSGSAGQPEKAEERAVADTFAGEQEQSEQGAQSAADAQSGSQQSASSQQGNQGSQQQQQNAANQSENQSASSSAGSSMMNKLKDSLANLLSSLKPQPGGSGGQQAKAQDGRQAGKNRQQGAAESASASGEPGEGGATQPGNAPPGGSGQGDKAEADKQKGTGAGRDDGSKDIRDAEQLQAMGKLATIFGKRAENVNGEFTVEAAPGPQVLRTPYAQRSTEHASAETVAMRDEVPLAYQDYVKHYYELVRKADATPKRSGRVMAASSRHRSDR